MKQFDTKISPSLNYKRSTFHVIRALRLAAVLLFLFLGNVGVKAQTASNAYIFYNANYGYLINNNGNPGVSTTFTKSAIWVANNSMGTNNRNVRSYTDNSKYFTGSVGTNNNSNGTFSLGDTNDNWQLRGTNYLNRRNATRGYVRYNGTGFIVNSSNTDQNFTGTGITINNRTASNPTISITASSGLTNGGIQLSSSITGTYRPSYYYATVRNYNNTNTQTYYWTESTEATTTQPDITSWNDATKNWAVTTGGAYASVSSDGLVTITGNPTGNVVVTLTVSKGGYIGTQTFTLTRAAITQNSTSETVMTNPTISPSFVALYYNESGQAFTASASATTTTTTIPAHTTLTGGGNTYYYYNGTLYTSTEDFKTISETHPDVTLTWSLSGDATSYLTRTPATGTSTTVTHTSQSPSDLTATLTVTASVTGASNKTATATIMAYGPMVAPTITQSGISISLATTSTGASIYYTTDGTTPSASNGTRYTVPFDLTSSPTTVKAITIRDTHSSSVTTNVISLKLPKPVISISNTGLATIALGEGSPAGTTIHYTTDGTTPTASSATYSAPVQLTALQSIMAIATLTGYDDSEVVTDDYVTPGVAGGKVILDDREDHNWTYYSGVDTSVDNGNYNTNYLGKIYSPNPRNVKITYRANNGAVSIDESDTVFVYYKTLEQGTTAGQYPYTVISNPFSKRPNGKGFGGWKIKEGADYISGYADEATLPLDAEIVFTNLPYPSVNCTSAEIELEATWVNLNNIVRRTNTGDYTYSTTGGTYETNILVIQRNQTGTITASSPVTIMMVEPDGSADYRGSYTFTGNITPNNNGVTKIEFTKWNSTNTLNCNNHSVTVGRGMTSTSQCANYVTGVTGSTNNNGRTTYNSNLNYHLKIESGVFTDVSFLAGTEGTAGYVSCNGTSNQVKGTLGNDYDRAKGDDTKLNITDELFLGYRPTYANGNQNSANFTCWVKSGNLCSGKTVSNTTFNNSGSPNGGYYGDANQVFYVSVGGAQTYIGKRTVYVEGGILSGIAGGIDSNNGANNESFFLRMTGGQVRGVVYGSGAFAASSGIRRFIITGGTINGWVAAGCNGTDPAQSGGTLPSDTYVYVGGTSHIGNTTDLTLNTSSDGNVFGAGSGNSAQATTGQVNNSNVVIADECYIKRNAYGGGNYGYSNATARVYVTGGEVAGSVFGGSNQKQGVTVNVNMTGGLVREGLYGGSNVTGTISGSVTMQINGGQVGTSSKTANIHGGGYGSATRVTQNVEITLGASGQTTPGVTVYGDVYGGSALGYVNGTAATNTYHTYVTLNKGTINGSLYGGGLGDGSTAANVYGPVQVKVYGGSVKKTDSNGANGSGGVYGANNVNGAPQRSVTVDIYGTDQPESGYALYAVYGGGNQANYTYGNGYPKVTVHNCDNSIEYVYGGGNAAAVAATDVTIYGGNVIGNVFGGGNGTVTAANVTGNTLTTIYGGTILRVFGGSNSQGTIGGTITVNALSQAEVTGETPCPMRVTELYGGGNMANSNVGSISIGCMGDNDMIDYVYGGANQANITGDISLTMSGGRIGNLFGGNNTSGSISGGINVTVNWDGSCDNNYLGNVFGGGNLAPYTIPSGEALAVNILNGTVSGNVYGGGKGDLVDGANRGAAGKVTGSPTVTIGDNINTHTAIVTGEVYGGGDAADVEGTPVIEVNDCATEIGYLYGGGNAADVSGTNITVNGGTIHNDAFGGGHGDKNATNPSKYADVNGSVTFLVKGGTIGRVFAGSNSKGTITGTSSLTINKDSSCDMKIGEVYGGGNEAAGKASSINIGCTGTLVALGSGERYGYEQEGIGAVYGGANQADIGTAQNHSNIEVNINSGIVANVFGGNNTSGDIYGTITVNIEKNNAAPCASDWYVGNVYGGGNLAQYTGSPEVNILNGTVSQNVYGGGKGDPTATGAQAGVPGSVTGNPVVTIGDNSSGHESYVAAVTGDVYGGGDAAKVTGTPVVNVVNKCNTTIANVYGGGNAADVSGTDVNIDGGTITGMVFGGGHGDKTSTPQKEANVGNGGVSVDITGGRISKVFGGSNSKGNITGSVAVNIEKGANSCDMHIDEVYGGGNQAAGNAGSITIVCTGGANEGIGDVYGGAREADINSDITLNITGGKINNVFGGNNIDGGINGGIEVNIDWDGSCAQNSLQNVYGGGNLAQYTIPNGKTLEVNILNGTVSQNVYGGGKGLDSDHTKGQVTGNPVVTIGDATKLNVNTVQAIVTGDVYGGGDAGNVVGTPQVNVINKCNTRIGNVYGGGNAADVSGTDVNIDGGTITGMVFGGGHGDKTSNPQKEANVGGNVSVDITGGTITKVFGGSNSKGNITGSVAVNIEKGANSCEMHIDEVYGGGNEAAGNAGTLTIGCTGDYDTNGEGIGDVYGGANAANINNNINLTIRGGHINNVYGGNNASGTISGTIAVNVNWNDALTCDKYLGNVFGGGNQASYTGSPTVTLTNGTVSHNVYGGGNLAGVGGSTVNINGGQVVEGVYGGCNTSGTVTGAIAVNINGGTLGTSSTSMTSGIFGGGYGVSTATEGNVTVTIGDVAGTYTPTIYADIYGGSALGNVNDAASDITTINFLNGTLHGNIFGGGLGDRASLGAGHADVAAKVNGKVIVNVSNTTQTAAQCKIDLRDATIYGCNNTNGSPQDDVTVNIYKTAYNYSDYATGDRYTAADGEHPYYAIDQVFGGGNQADYLPENGAANSTKKAVVHIYGCNNTVRRVFGGGNAAAATGIQTIIDGGRYYYVFGGGNGESSAANIGLGGTDLQIHGGQINTLFGGSNTSGTITGPMRVDVDADGTCGSDMYVDKFFCGNNLANIGTQQNPTNIIASIGCGTKFGTVYGGCKLAEIFGNVTLTIEGGEITTVYGGSEGDLSSLGTGHTDTPANINGNVTLNITGGKIDNAFGGSNINGNITGTITVNVEKDADLTCGWQLGNVYGASNLAAYTPTTPGSYPAVNIKNGEVTGNVFGGGLGATAIVTSNPVVTIGDNSSGHEGYVASVGGDVYGGGDAGNVAGTTQVNVVNKCNTTISGNVYGGGNAANVNGTDVNIDGGTITGMVFGGGHGDKDATPSPISANVNGNVAVDVTGGTIAKVFGGSNSKGNISGTVAVNITKGANSCDMHITEVYGGGNEAAGNAGTITIGCTGSNQEGISYVYGGARAADINSGITLNITGGNIDYVFGGNNVSGSISGDIGVNINWTEPSSCGYNHLGYVYGAGNKADFSGNTTVNIQKGTVSNDVFGGGLEASVAGNVTVNVSGGLVSGAVYGGGALANTNTGSNKTTTVNLTGGTVTDVYGGGLGRLADTANNIEAVAALVGGNVTVTLDGSVVTGNIFGCNNINGTPKGHVKVWVKKTMGWTGHDLSQGKRDDTIAKGTGVYELAAVYGGGNMAAYEPTNASTEYTEVVIDGCGETSIEYVYGGGNAASVPATEVTVNGTYELGYLFGGGNGRDNLPNGDPNPGANVGYKADGTTTYGTGIAQVNALGGTIYHVFGGSNTLGNVREEAVAYIDEVDDTRCPLQLGEVYGGGNEAYMAGDAQIKLGCISYLKEIYGGAKAANFGGDVELTITSGRFDRVFGGNNVSGVLDGSIRVNIEETGCHPIVIGELYGCGNKAAYTTPNGKPDPVINIKSFTSIGRVFGGGLGNSAVVTGNPTVNVNVFEGLNSNGTVAQGNYSYDPAHFDADGNFTGWTINFRDDPNNSSTVTSTVNVPNHLKGEIGAIGTVFGGGNAAAVDGNTAVNIGTKEYEYIVVTVATGASVSSYYTRNDDDTYSAASGTAVAGKTYYERKAVLGADIRGNVFGGGNAADVTGNTNVVIGKED